MTDKLSRDQRQTFLALIIPSLPTNPAATLDEVAGGLPDTAKRQARQVGWRYDYRGRPVQEVPYKYPAGDPPRPEWADDIQDWESPRGHFIEGCLRLGLKQDDTLADILRVL